jgi:drug/metabolite transporter (DMT)-like permease
MDAISVLSAFCSRWRCCSMIPNSAKRLRAELALAGVTLIWGTTFVVVKAALEEVSTFLYLTLRFTLAAAVLFLVYRNALKRSAITAGVIAGTALFVAYVFQTTGLKLTTPSKSAFLTGLSIPMVPLLNSLVYRVKPRILDLAGIGIASVGMVLLTVPAGGFAGNGLRLGTLGWNLGDALSFLCAVTFALHIVVIGHYSKIHGFETLAVTQIAVTAVLSLLVFGLLEPTHFHFTPGVAGAVLSTGLLATALAFTTQAWAQQYTSSARAALIFSLEPPVAWLTSWWLTGEKLTQRGKLGAGLILAGILLVELTRGKVETIPVVGTSK